MAPPDERRHLLERLTLMVQKFLVHDDEEEVELVLNQEGGRTLVRRKGEDHWRQVELEQVGESGLYVLMIDNRPTELYLERRRGGAEVVIGRHTFSYDVGPWRPGSSRPKNGGAAAGLVRITAPMTGSIVEVRVAAGQVVAQGEVVLIIESMKMNNELRSPAAGTVEAIPVTAGTRVKANDLLVAIRTAQG